MFYAITGLGWGRGETVEEAETNYVNAQRRNFPHLSDEDLMESWGFIWRVPDGTVGFFHDYRLHWKLEDGSTTEATAEQKVKPIGDVPKVAIPEHLQTN